MGVTDAEFEAALHLTEAMRAQGYIVSATYDAPRLSIGVVLSSGEELRLDPARTRTLARASPEELADIEISLSGLELLWPRLDDGMSLDVIRDHASREPAGERVSIRAGK